jgi:hypothetical protein
MKRILTTAAALTAVATAAQAGGIDRSGQGLGALFEKGRYVELSYGLVSPTVDGDDVALFGGQPTGDVVGSYAQLALRQKRVSLWAQRYSRSARGSRVRICRSSALDLND